jgi:uncharacterized protein YbjT (DUF2867 family)
LRERGHDVRVLSRRAGKGTHVGDLDTGAGVAEAAAGADVVVHAASQTGGGQGKRDPDQVRHLLDASRSARHLVYISIVGIEGIPLGYYRRKLECERLIEAAPVPHTILRATQFHELVAGAFASLSRFPVAGFPLNMRAQPVAAAECAERLAGLAGGEPLGRAPDFGGPEVLTAREMLATWRTRHDRPRAFNLPLPLPVFRAFREGRNTCPGHRDGRQTWAEFVAAT